MVLYKISTDKSQILIDQRDSSEYKIAKIGDTFWFTENLRYKSTKGKIWYPNNDKELAEKFGVLYDLNAIQGACPCDWRVATDNDWKKLEKRWGLQQEMPLEKTGMWREISNPIKYNKTDNFFLIENMKLPLLGYKSSNNTSSTNYKKAAYFWAPSTNELEYLTYVNWTRRFFPNHNAIGRYKHSAQDGINIRCVTNRINIRK